MTPGHWSPNQIKLRSSITSFKFSPDHSITTGQLMKRNFLLVNAFKFKVVSEQYPRNTSLLLVSSDSRSLSWLLLSIGAAELGPFEENDFHVVVASRQTHGRLGHGHYTHTVQGIIDASSVTHLHWQHWGSARTRHTYSVMPHLHHLLSVSRGT